MLAGITSFLGVIIMADPLSLYTSSYFPSPSTQITSMNRMTATVLALYSVFATTGAFVIIRLINNRAHPLIQVNYYSLCSTLISSLLLLIPTRLEEKQHTFLPSTLREGLLLACVGICGFMLQFLMTAGLQADPSSRATNMMYIQIMFAMALDWSIWERVPGWGSLGGEAVVLSGVIWGCIGRGEASEKNSDGYNVLESEEYSVELLHEVGIIEEDG
jgi:drug/metabolite transporter (DMT)-like permease